jgi:hypothetical protein
VGARQEAGARLYAVGGLTWPQGPEYAVPYRTVAPCLTLLCRKSDPSRWLAPTLAPVWHFPCPCAPVVILPSASASRTQLAVTGAMLAGLRQLVNAPLPLCQRCNIVLLPEAMHVDCAEAHFTQLHTRGCRLCGISMPPSHARFCNSCAYRRNK